MKNFDQSHRDRIIAYLKKVDNIHSDLVNAIANAAVLVELEDEIFRFANYPKIAGRVDAIFLNYIKTLNKLLNDATASEWDFANAKYDALREATIERLKPHIASEAYEAELKAIGKEAHNMKALEAFQRRKVGKFTISERVWDIGAQAKENIEYALDLSLKKGISAQQLAREIKKNLNNPDALYRRVRDKHGNLKPSKAAKAYKPGQGVYRSANKNALRLAANEINTAYRQSEQLRLEHNNDVVGVEIHLSPSHRIYDMCDDLKGRYPKDFQWSQWHVGCKCFRTSILKKDEELISEINSGRNEPPENSDNYVGKPPPQLHKWIDQNADKMKNWKRKPDFIEDNKKFMKWATEI